MADKDDSGTKTFMTMAEAARLTGLSPGRIRYYDQEFGDFLKIPRGPGSRRLFDQAVIERLMTLTKLLKEDGLSIRQAKSFLGLGGGPGPVKSALGKGDEGLADRVADLERRIEVLAGVQDEMREVLTRLVAMVSGLLERIETLKSR